jgi:hypothetical protein
MLSSRITIPAAAETEAAEDILASAADGLFPGQTRDSHGTPGQAVEYASPRFGPLALGIPAHPDAEDGRRLFAHYLWNAAVLAADAIEWASSGGEEDGEEGVVGERGEEVGEKGAWAFEWPRRWFDVRGKTALELGAGRLWLFF